MSYKNFLSFSITDSICTGTLCRYDSDENVMEIKDICRFSNSEIYVSNHRYHDILSVFSHIKKGISKALKETDNNIENNNTLEIGNTQNNITNNSGGIRNTIEIEDNSSQSNIEIYLYIVMGVILLAIVVIVAILLKNRKSK